MAAGRERCPRIWCNVDEGVRTRALIQLLVRAKREEPGLRVTLTAQRGVRLPGRLPDGVELPAPMPDLNKGAEKFVRDLAPDLAILTGGDLLPSAIHACGAAGIPVIVVEGRIESGSGLRSRWSDFRARGRLRHLRRIFASSPEDATRFRRAGAERERVEVLGALSEGQPAPPCNAAERDSLAAILATRPVWFAYGVHSSELEAIEKAHRAASRLSHRLMLIVAPDNPDRGPEFRDRFGARDWNVALRSEGADPEPDVQVYVADLEHEAGLWLRLAPITFLGSSLARPGGGQNPYEPAALGSAILHGPHMQRFAEETARLDGAGCTMSVTDGAALGEALTFLLSPDRAARMAHRAWEVTSEGAEESERALEVILSFLQGDSS